MCAALALSPYSVVYAIQVVTLILLLVQGYIAKTKYSSLVLSCWVISPLVSSIRYSIPHLSIFSGACHSNRLLAGLNSKLCTAVSAKTKTRESYKFRFVARDRMIRLISLI